MFKKIPYRTCLYNWYNWNWIGWTCTSSESILILFFLLFVNIHHWFVISATYSNACLLCTFKYSPHWKNVTHQNVVYGDIDLKCNGQISYFGGPHVQYLKEETYHLQLYFQKRNFLKFGTITNKNCTWCHIFFFSPYL